MRIEEHEDGPIEEVLLAPAIVRLVAAELATEVSSRDFQRHLDGLGARLAEAIGALPELPAEVRGALAVEVSDADLAGLDAAVMARIEMAAGAKQALPSAWVAALAIEVEAPPGELAPAVMARIEALEPAATLGAEVVAALAAEVPAMPGELVGAVMARVEAVELEAVEADALPAQVVRALADEAEAGADPSLHRAVMARIERLIEDELASDAPALGAVQRELEAEGERMHAARVVSEVEAEVRAIGPRIEREMPRAVLARIAPAEDAPRASNPPRPRAEARIGPPLGTPTEDVPRYDAPAAPATPVEVARGYGPPRKAKGRSWLAGPGRAAIATVLAAAAAVLLYLRPATQPTDPGLTPLHALGPRGEVHVDEIDYDGTVTVTETDGLAVIWLADAPST